MKIAQANLQPDYGGAERHVWSLACGLRDLGHDVTLLCHPQGRLCADADRLGLPSASFALQTQIDPAAILRLTWLLRRLRPDVLHLHTPKDYLAGTLAGRLARVPVTVVTRHMMLPVKPHMHRLYRRVDAVVCPSRALRDDLQAQDVPAGQLALIQGAISSPPFSVLSPVQRTAARAALGLGEADIAVGIIGRLVPGKGHDFLLDAAAQLNTLPITVVMVGDGAEQAALQAQAIRLGLAERVIFTGFRDDVAQILPLLDIVALASTDTEVMPLTVLEALAAGRAVAATRVGGVPEIIQDGVHGLLIPPRDTDALAAALRRLADDPTLRTRLGEAGAERVAAQFTLPRMLTEMEALYRRLLTVSL